MQKNKLADTADGNEKYIGNSLAVSSKVKNTLTV